MNKCCFASQLLLLLTRYLAWFPQLEKMFHFLSSKLHFDMAVLPPLVHVLCRAHVVFMVLGHQYPSYAVICLCITSIGESVRLTHSRSTNSR